MWPELDPFSLKFAGSIFSTVANQIITLTQMLAMGYHHTFVKHIIQMLYTSYCQYRNTGRKIQKSGRLFYKCHQQNPRTLLPHQMTMRVPASTISASSHWLIKSPDCTWRHWFGLVRLIFTKGLNWWCNLFVRKSVYKTYGFAIKSTAIPCYSFEKVYTPLAFSLKKM